MPPQYITDSDSGEDAPDIASLFDVPIPAKRKRLSEDSPTTGKKSVCVSQVPGMKFPTSISECADYVSARVKGGYTYDKSSKAESPASSDTTCMSDDEDDKGTKKKLQIKSESSATTTPATSSSFTPHSSSSPAVPKVIPSKKQLKQILILRADQWCLDTLSFNPLVLPNVSTLVAYKCLLNDTFVLVVGTKNQSVIMMGRLKSLEEEKKIVTLESNMLEMEFDLDYLV